MELPLAKEMPSLSSLPTWADLLAATGLQSRPATGVDIVSGVSLFAAGLLVGAGLGLLFAPSSGERLRQDLGQRIGELRERLETGLGGLTAEDPEPPRQGRVA